MPKIRWFMLMLALAVLSVALFKKDLENAMVAFSLGLFYGLLIDFVGVKVLPLWKYKDSKWVYIFITIPCWGAFSMAVNLPWDWIGNSWLAFPIITIGLFAYLELPNLKTRSWKYTTPLWLAAIGWIPLVLSFRGTYLLFFYLVAFCEQCPVV